MTVLSYAELVAQISFDAVVGASRYFRERDAAFPPSAGEFFSYARQFEKRLADKRELESRVSDYRRKAAELAAEKRALLPKTEAHEVSF